MASYILNAPDLRERREIDATTWTEMECYLRQSIDASMAKLSRCIGRHDARLATLYARDAADLWETLRRFQHGSTASVDVPPIYRAPIDLGQDVLTQLVVLARNYVECRRINLPQRAYSQLRVDHRDGWSATGAVSYLSGNGSVLIEVVPYLPDYLAEILVR